MVKSGGSKKKNISKADKRRLITGGAILILFVVFWGSLAWLVHPGNPKEIVAVADQFKPDSSWKLISENIQPPKMICIDVECPSIQREWSAQKQYTKLEAIALFKDARWKINSDIECFYNTYTDEQWDECDIYGSYQAYDIHLNIENQSNKSILSIGIHQQ